VHLSFFILSPTILKRTTFPVEASNDPVQSLNSTQKCTCFTRSQTLNERTTSSPPLPPPGNRIKIQHFAIDLHLSTKPKSHTARSVRRSTSQLHILFIRYTNQLTPSNTASFKFPTFRGTWPHTQYQKLSQHKTASASLQRGT